MDFSPEQIEQIGKSTAKHLSETGVHCISFDEETRKTVHMVHEARTESGATHGDLVLTFQLGKSMNQSMIDTIKKGFKAVMILGVLIICVLALKAWGVWEMARAIVAPR